MSECRETDLTTFLAKFFKVDLATRLGVDHLAGQLEAVSGADHRRQSPFSLFSLRNSIRKWPYAPSAGKAQSRRRGFLRGQFVGCSAVLSLDSGHPEGLADP